MYVQVTYCICVCLSFCPYECVSVCVCVSVYLYVRMHTRVCLCVSVEGGELFDRIVDEKSPLTEADAMAFVRQICEGVHYMHQMFVLHLDLKVGFK